MARLWAHPKAQALDTLAQLYNLLRDHELTVRGCLVTYDSQARFARIMRELPDILEAAKNTA